MPKKRSAVLYLCPERLSRGGFFWRPSRRYQLLEHSTYSVIVDEVDSCCLTRACSWISYTSTSLNPSCRTHMGKSFSSGSPPSVFCANS